MFAKLYETDVGQILVKKGDDEDGQPVIEFYFHPEAKGLGVCSVMLEFFSDDDGESNRDEAFEKVDESFAYKTVKTALDTIGNAFDNSEE